MDNVTGENLQANMHVHPDCDGAAMRAMLLAIVDCAEHQRKHHGFVGSILDISMWLMTCIAEDPEHDGKHLRRGLEYAVGLRGFGDELVVKKGLEAELQNLIGGK